MGGGSALGISAEMANVSNWSLSDVNVNDNDDSDNNVDGDDDDKNKSVRCACALRISSLTT